MAVQVFALVEIHHQIGGVVHLEKIQHPHNMRMTNLSDGLRFLEKGFAAIVKTVFVIFRVQDDGLVIRGAAYHLRRVVFLDRDFHLQRYVKAAIGDAKAALSELFAHDVIFELNAHREQRRRTPCRTTPKVADGTGSRSIPGLRVKTARTGDIHCG